MRHDTILGKFVRRLIYYINCKFTATANKGCVESVCRSHHAAVHGRETCLHVRVRW